MTPQAAGNLLDKAHQPLPQHLRVGDILGKRRFGGNRLGLTVRHHLPIVDPVRQLPIMLANWLANKNRGSRAKLLKMAADNVPVEERQFGAGSTLRPDFIEFNRCKNVLIEGVHIRRSPMWCTASAPVHECDDSGRGSDLARTE